MITAQQSLSQEIIIKEINRLQQETIDNLDIAENELKNSLLFGLLYFLFSKKD